MKLDSELVSPRQFRIDDYILDNKYVLSEKLTNLITVSKLMNYYLKIEQHYKDRYKKEDCQFSIIIKPSMEETHQVRFFIYKNKIEKMYYVGTVKDGWETHFDDFSALINVHFNITKPSSFYLEVLESEHMIQLVELINKYI